MINRGVTYYGCGYDLKNRSNGYFFNEAGTGDGFADCGNKWYTYDGSGNGYNFEFSFSYGGVPWHENGFGAGYNKFGGGIILEQLCDWYIPNHHCGWNCSMPDHYDWEVV
jgi:hypothetical protein